MDGARGEARSKSRVMSPEATTPGVESAWIGPPRPSVAGIWRGLVGVPAQLARHRRMVQVSVLRDLRARFSGTVLGWGWPLLQPLVLFGVYAFVFTKLFGVRLPATPPGSEGLLGVYMFLGVLVWSSIAESLARGAQSISGNANLIAKVAFPAQLLPLNTALSNLAMLGLGLAGFLVVSLLAPLGVRPGPLLLWLPVLALAQLLFVWGLSLALATLQVYLRDTAHMLGLALTLGMFATPIFWVPSRELLPAAGPYLELVTSNPFHHLVQAWRLALMGDAPAVLFTDSFNTSLCIVLAWAGASFVCGHALFTLGRPGFADEV